MTTSYDPSGLKRSLAAAQAKIARLTQRAEKAEAERDHALARIKTLTILNSNGYSAGYDAGVNAAVAKYEFAMKGDAHVYGIDQMMSLISNNSDTVPETENQKETEK